MRQGNPARLTLPALRMASLLGKEEGMIALVGRLVAYWCLWHQCKRVRRRRQFERLVREVSYLRDNVLHVPLQWEWVPK